MEFYFLFFNKGFQGYIDKEVLIKPQLHSIKSSTTIKPKQIQNSNMKKGISNK